MGSEWTGTASCRGELCVFHSVLQSTCIQSAPWRAWKTENWGWGTNKVQYGREVRQDKDGRKKNMSLARRMCHGDLAESRFDRMTGVEVSGLGIGRGRHGVPTTTQRIFGSKWKRRYQGDEQDICSVSNPAAPLCLSTSLTTSPQLIFLIPNRFFF